MGRDLLCARATPLLILQRFRVFAPLLNGSFLHAAFGYRIRYANIVVSLNALSAVENYFLSS